MAYEKDKDYQALIDEAAANGDTAAAAQYERQRNEKIDGEGLNAAKTYNYYGYNPNTDYQALIDEADSKGDYLQAAAYERQRNDKIDGEAMSYGKSSKYQPYSQAYENAGKAYNSYMNRDKFSYNAAEDPLYQQYKEQYMSQGKLAMQDTMAQAAALTGGYANSYAQTAGQQMYNQYAAKAADAIPQLYEAAYGRYRDEGTDLMNAYQLSQSRANQEWSQLDQQRQLQYQQQENERSAANSYVQAMLSMGIMPNSEMLSKSDWTAEDAQKYINALLAQAGASGSTGGSGGSGGRSSYWRSSETEEPQKDQVSEQTYEARSTDQIASYVQAWWEHYGRAIRAWNIDGENKARNGAEVMGLQGDDIETFVKMARSLWDGK